METLNTPYELQAQFSELMTNLTAGTHKDYDGATKPYKLWLDALHICNGIHHLDDSNARKSLARLRKHVKPGRLADLYLLIAEMIDRDIATRLQGDTHNIAWDRNKSTARAEELRKLASK